MERLVIDLPPSAYRPADRQGVRSSHRPHTPSRQHTVIQTVLSLPLATNLRTVIADDPATSATSQPCSPQSGRLPW